MQAQTAVLIGIIIAMVVIFALFINSYNNQAQFLRSQVYQYQNLYDQERSANLEIVDCFNENKGSYVYHTPCLLEYN